MTRKNNKEIRKVHRMRDILISAGTLALGIIYLRLLPSSGWLGWTLIITGAIMLPFYRSGYKLNVTNGIFSKQEILLPNGYKNEIASFIEGRCDTLDIDPFNKGGLLLELYSLKGNSKMYAQIFNYESDIYTPQCKLSEIDGAKLETLRKYES